MRLEMKQRRGFPANDAASNPPEPCASDRVAVDAKDLQSSASFRVLKPARQRFGAIGLEVAEGEVELRQLGRGAELEVL